MSQKSPLLLLGKLFTGLRRCFPQARSILCFDSISFTASWLSKVRRTRSSKRKLGSESRVMVRAGLKEETDGQTGRGGVIV